MVNVTTLSLSSGQGGDQTTASSVLADIKVKEVLVIVFILGIWLYSMHRCLKSF